MNRYYSRLRPIAPGTYPREGVQAITNDDDKSYVDEAGCEAWGHIDYDRELTPEEMNDYDLVPGGFKTYWVVSTSIDDRGHIASAIVGTEQHYSKPEQVYRSTRRRDIYIDYFETREAAEQHVAESRNA